MVIEKRKSKRLHLLVREKLDTLTRISIIIMSLFHQYTVISLIISIFPDHKWLIWKFKAVPNGYWKKRKSKRLHLLVREKVRYNTMEDWYKVSSADFYNNYGSSLLNVYFSINKNNEERVSRL